VLEALPFGFALGIHYKPGDTWYRGWFHQVNGLGLNPMIEIGGKKAPARDFENRQDHDHQ
jgi:hypothetical protein